MHLSHVSSDAEHIVSRILSGHAYTFTVQYLYSPDHCPAVHMVDFCCISLPSRNKLPSHGDKCRKKASSLQFAATQCVGLLRHLCIRQLYDNAPVSSLRVSVEYGRAHLTMLANGFKKYCGNIQDKTPITKHLQDKDLFT